MPLPESFGDARLDLLRGSFLSRIRYAMLARTVMRGQSA